MSAVHKSVSQIAPRVGFLKAINTTIEYYLSGEPSAVMTVAAWQSVATDSGSRASGNMYRDMGRRVRVVDADGLNTAEYTRVQLVSGVGSEGVPDNASFGIAYVKTYDAEDPSRITVVRTG